MLRAEVERAPLIRAAASVASAPSSPGGELEALRHQVAELEADLVDIRNDRSMLSATVAGLRSEVSRLQVRRTSGYLQRIACCSVAACTLEPCRAPAYIILPGPLDYAQEDKADAESTIGRLSAEMEELADALDTSNNENERLSMEVFELRSKVEELEGDGAASAASEEPRRRSLQSAASASSADVPVPVTHGPRAAAAERELAAARALTRELLQQMAVRGMYGVPPDDEDLTDALKLLQVRASVLLTYNVWF